MYKTPVLIVSDTPNGPTGLGTSTREIATRMFESMSDVCEVAVAGYGDEKKNLQPFPVYPFSELVDWKIPELPWIWERFAGDRKGIIFTIWNISWLPWFTHPHLLPNGKLRDFLMSERFEHWAYVPIDSEGPNGRLSEAEEKILRKIPRVLPYSKFGAEVIDRTLGNSPGTTLYIPHGTDGKIFYPRSRKEARETLLGRVGVGGKMEVSGDVILIGIFATNTSRKDWPLGIEVCGRLVEKGYNIGLLIHTDSMKKNWNLTELCLQFGLKGRTIESPKSLTNEDVAWLYAACDCTLAVGAGEGWGLPITESMACGVPVVHGNYAGGACEMPPDWLVEPCGYRYEGFYSNKRPVFNVDDWVKVVERIMIPRNKPRTSFLGKEMMWDAVWPHWEEWLRKGLNNA